MIDGHEVMVCILAGGVFGALVIAAATIIAVLWNAL